LLNTCKGAEDFIPQEPSQAIRDWGFQTPASRPSGRTIVSPSEKLLWDDTDLLLKVTITHISPCQIVDIIKLTLEPEKNWFQNKTKENWVLQRLP
jgi:hypothetical protein